MGVAVAISLVEGAPARLPGLALGSGVLLHAERTLALLAVAIAVVTIVTRAAQGRLPVELSTTGVRYEPAVPRVTAANVEELQGDVDDLDATVSGLAREVDRLRRLAYPAGQHEQ